MSMVRQIIQAVTLTQQQIDDQISKLQAYNGQIDQILNRVQAELSGSTQSYTQEMINQLQLTKKQVEDSITKLQTAKEKLNQVKMI